MINKIEEGFKQFYTSKSCRGLSTVFTPKVVRDKMTIHAKADMKILVMFNFEFCYDLWKMGFRKYVMFVSDDQIRNDIVEKAFGFMAELVDPKDINKKLKDMKFSLIISNPPYNRNLDLKILESISDMGENICIVHPAGWLLDKKNINDIHVSLKNKLNDRISNIELISGQEVFGIRTQAPLCITNIINRRTEPISIIDNSGFYENLRYNVDSIYDIDKWGNDEIYTQIRDKIIKFTQEFNLTKLLNLDTSFPLTMTHYGVQMDPSFPLSCWFVLVYDNLNKHIQYKTLPSTTLYFNNEHERKNCFNFLKTKMARFCLSLLKVNMHIDTGELKHVPLLDFSKSWDNYSIGEALGMNYNEIEYAISKIGNFYKHETGMSKTE